MTEGERRRLEEVLNEREYQVYYEQSESVMERLINTVLQWLEELFIKLFPSLEPSNSFSSIVLIIIIIIATIILGYIIFRLIQRVNRKDKIGVGQPLQYKKELNWTYEQHRLEALEKEGSKDYSEATRHLFLALLLYFHEKKWLEARSWKTNWGYYEELSRKNGNAARTFYDITEVFEAVTYGKNQVTEADYVYYRNEVMSYLRDKNIDVEG